MTRVRVWIRGWVQCIVYSLPPLNLHHTQTTTTNIKGCDTQRGFIYGGNILEKFLYFCCTHSWKGMMKYYVGISNMINQAEIEVYGREYYLALHFTHQHRRRKVVTNSGRYHNIMCVQDTWHQQEGLYTGPGL